MKWLLALSYDMELKKSSKEGHGESLQIYNLQLPTILFRGKEVCIAMPDYMLSFTKEERVYFVFTL